MVCDKCGFDMECIRVEPTGVENERLIEFECLCCDNKKEIYEVLCPDCGSVMGNSKEGQYYFCNCYGREYRLINGKLVNTTFRFVPPEPKE